jgi:lambda repressor-like predicted transcriptional regulator
MENPGKSMSHLAAEAGVSASHFTRVLRLSFLAPDIVHAMLRDRHPLELNAERLSKRMDLPYAWDAQRIHLGID